MRLTRSVKRSPERLTIESWEWLGVADPVVGGGIPAQVAAPDDADVVELEALGGVDAADLVEAVRVGGPEVRGRDAGGEAAGIGPGVPGHLPGADLDVGDERAVGVRVAPGPAEAGGQAGGVALIGLRSDQGVELLDRVDDAEVERLALGIPGRVGGLGEAERAVDPAAGRPSSRRGGTGSRARTC